MGSGVMGSIRGYGVVGSEGCGVSQGLWSQRLWGQSGVVGL